MIKKLGNLAGVKFLSAREQRDVKGGAFGNCCNPELSCCLPNGSGGKTCASNCSFCPSTTGICV